MVTTQGIIESRTQARKGSADDHPTKPLAFAAFVAQSTTLTRRKASQMEPKTMRASSPALPDRRSN